MDDFQAYLATRIGYDMVGAQGINQTTALQSQGVPPAMLGWIPESLREKIRRRHLKLVWSATGSGCGKTER